MTFNKPKFMYLKVNDSREDAIVGPLNTFEEYKRFVDQVDARLLAEPVFSMAPETPEKFLSYVEAKDGPWTTTPTEILIVKPFTFPCPGNGVEIEGNYDPEEKSLTFHVSNEALEGRDNVTANQVVEFCKIKCRARRHLGRGPAVPERPRSHPLTVYTYVLPHSSDVALEWAIFRDSPG